MGREILSAYGARLRRAAKEAVPALMDGVALRRNAAATVFGAAAGLTIAALARHQRRRPDDREAARSVIEKSGHVADVVAPALAVRAHLADPRLDPRLGGLFGDAGPLLVAWLAEVTGAPPERLANALAASVPLALGALRATAPTDQLPNALSEVPDGVLSEPARLLDPATPCGRAFRQVRRGGLPLLVRWRG